MKSVNPLWLTVLILMLTPLSLFAQTSQQESPFSIARSNTDGIQVHFDLPQWKLESIKNGNETAQKVSIADAQYIFIDEEETLPVFTTLIAIPYCGGVTLNTLGSSQQNRSNISLDFDSTLAKERNNKRYSASLYPENKVLMSAPQVLRDFRVVSINIYPFQYDQQNKQLIINESVDISIDFDRSPSINEIAPPTSYSSAFEKIYSGLILNYNEAIDREVTYTSPKLLVIYGNYNDTTYQAKVNEYVTWKRQKGFIVNPVSTSTTGTSNTAIKTYIQNQYDNPNTRPDYIVLIGDESGTITVPTYNGYVDYYYTWLAGGDNLGDVIIGRISVNNTSQMINYIGKLMTVERDINISNASWLDRMVLVGDTASSGISTVYTNRYIHDHSLAINPDYTYTELYGSGPSSTSINSAITQGVAFYNYRGYIGMSGWPSSMSNINNAYRLFHAVFITCNTGTFGGGTSTTEEVVRLGTEAAQKGALTAIGMATSSTHTPLNNCLNVGIFHGIYPMGMRDMGSAMLYGKLYLNAIYGVSNPSQMLNFSQFCNLIGDPTATVYVSIPSTFNVTAPTSIPAGTSNMEVTVRDSANQLVEGASVTLTNATGYQVVGFSGNDGKVLLSFSNTLSGSLTLTVSKDDYKPASSSIEIAAGGGMVFYGTNLVDDGTGSSEGNGNNTVNNGETIDLYVNVRNTTSSMQPITGEVFCSDPYVTLINYHRIDFPDIPAGGFDDNISPICFALSPSCPDNYDLLFNLTLHGVGNTWNLLVPLTVRNGRLDIQAYTYVGAPGNYIYPGDQRPLTISLKNFGLGGLDALHAVLRSHDIFFSVIDSLGYYPTIAPNATASNSSDTFSVYARGSCVDGMLIPLDLYLYNGDEFQTILPLTLTVGQITVADPLGQDSYGYFIFDDGDTAYTQCPTYQWIGIAPAEGGTGTALNLTDPGNSSDEGDQVGAVTITTVTLPFAFKFYGVNYTQASICSNGFIAFGTTLEGDWRNWRMPNAGGPSPMIAAFWDDLDRVSGTSNVYTYYNPTLHYYVVEWYNMVSGYNDSSHQTFQAILYDPIFFPTQTGDGQVKIQYNEIHNIDTGDGDAYPHGNYCTIGIEDHTENIGLEYTYNNSYPTAAAPLHNQMALFITTRAILPDYPYIALEQVTVVDANSNNHLEPGETAELAIRLGNRGLVDAAGVSAVLSSSDPYVTITAPSALYGNIPAQGNALPLSNFGVSVSTACPGGHAAALNLAISSETGSWNYQFTLIVYTPVLEFGSVFINDTIGDHDGVLDPGETAQITIPLQNTGEVPSLPGTASLVCSTTGVTVINGSASFASIPGGSSANLTFTLSTSLSIAIGTVVSLSFDASAGAVTANKVEYATIGIIIETFETGNFSYLSWTQGTPPWTIDNSTVHGGIYAAKSGLIDHGQSTSIETSRVLSTSGTITFWYKVSSEANYDYLKFYIDNTSQGSWSGEVGWAQASYTVPTGTHVLKWVYSKDGSVANGSDCAWVDDIVFPASTSSGFYFPPQNLTAVPSHQSVSLSWSPPASGAPNSYFIYRNALLFTGITATNYMDLDVSNGTTYTYSVTAIYPGGESAGTETVTVTPNALAPTGLTATPGNGTVDLNWYAPGGRENLLSLGSANRSISGYKVFRNGVGITTITVTSYHDTGLINGNLYNYYVTTLYANPEGQSGPSNTVSATPALLTSVILGSGTQATTNTTLSPISNKWKSIHGQSVYTASEFNSAGVTGPVLITQIGFRPVTAPNLALVNFVIRMKHTTSTDAADWSPATELVTVYSNAAYMPTIGNYDMLTLSTPFLWNGTDNILIDTAFGMLSEYSNTGTLQYTSVPNGYLRIGSDTANQTDVYSGGSATDYRPNIQLSLVPQTSLETLALTGSISLKGYTLSWPAERSAQEYQVYSASQPDGPYKLLITTSNLTYTDTRVLGKAFYYVKAIRN